ncbi:hypothetical protein ACV56Z_15045 [Staphylococcus aureus]
MMQQQIQMLMQHQNTGQPNVSETTDNGKADASPTTPNNSDAATGEQQKHQQLMMQRINRKLITILVQMHQQTVRQWITM